MAVAGLTGDGRHRDMEYPHRSPSASPNRVRSSYSQPGISLTKTTFFMKIEALKPNMAESLTPL